MNWSIKELSFLSQIYIHLLESQKWKIFCIIDKNTHKMRMNFVHKQIGYTNRLEKYFQRVTSTTILDCRWIKICDVNSIISFLAKSVRHCIFCYRFPKEGKVWENTMYYSKDCRYMQNGILWSTLVIINTCFSTGAVKKKIDRRKGGWKRKD